MAAAFLARRPATRPVTSPRCRRASGRRPYTFRLGGADRIIRFATVVEEFQNDRAAARLASPDLRGARVLEIGVALGTMSYQAFTGDWTSLDWTAQRTLELATTWYRRSCGR